MYSRLFYVNIELIDHYEIWWSMMKCIRRFISVLLCVILVASCFFGCSKKVESTPVNPENFRVTAYVVADRLDETFDASNLSRVTDIILFGNATFDEQGNITLTDGFENELAFLRSFMTGQNLYLNILGPSAQTESDDWNEQMHDLADRHTAAFEAKVTSKGADFETQILENNIKSVLEKYGFDGVVFDYEFPLRSKDWKAFDKFIVSLDGVLGDDYKIGMSMVGWNLKQSEEAKNATDFFEVMSYDLWDDDGNHATIDIAEDDMKLFEKKGYDKSKLDLGVPFYARPTTKEAYWYDYKGYYDSIDDNGLYEDKELGLTFSFNTYDVIKEKTDMAIDNGWGGMMIWHYSCDVSADNEKSLFGAIDSAKQEAAADKQSASN